MCSTRWDQDPLEPVMAKARELGRCPVGLVDEFTSEHWDAFEICSWFECESCVATPDDFGCAEGAYSIGPDEETGGEIPF